MKSIIALLLCVVLLFSFSACDKSVNEQAVSSTDTVSRKTQSYPVDAILPATEIGGVILLGGFDSYEQFADEIKSSKYLEDVPQLAEIKETEFVSTDGGYETYAIIVPSNATSINIYELVYSDDLSVADKGDLLYGNGGNSVKPIILKCNVSDLRPDHLIVVLYEDGSSDDFSLYTSLKDGTVRFDGNNANFKDLTKYE